MPLCYGYSIEFFLPHALFAIVLRRMSLKIDIAICVLTFDVSNLMAYQSHAG